MLASSREGGRVVVNGDAGPLPVGIDDVRAASAAFGGAIVRTPTAVSRTLSEQFGATVVCKFESFQFTASYKERGALNRLRLLDPAERERGVVAMSAGNHAQGVAYHAHRLGIPATIVMPARTPAVKVARTRVLGAEVVLHGDSLAAAEAEAWRIQAAHGATFVHPFDDAAVIAGQGTIALELFEDAPDIDVVVVPVGGGGLISGVATVVKALYPGVEVVGVQSERYPSLAATVRGQSYTAGGTTIAEAIAVAAPGVLTQQIAGALVDDFVVVPEARLEEAVCLLLEVEKVVAEGAGAAGLAAMLHEPSRFKGKTVATVVTGGNIEPRLLASALLRSLVRAGRLLALRVHVDDEPGALAAVANCIAEQGGNVVEVRHDRLLPDISIRAATLELAVEVLDAAHGERISQALVDAGYGVGAEDVIG